MNEDILNEKYESHAIDPIKLFKGYLKHEDWRVKENASTAYSVGAFQNYISSAMTSGYWLDYVYPKFSNEKEFAEIFRLPNGDVDDHAISNAHRNCDFHIHDLGFYGAYCNGLSLKQLIETGITGINSNADSAPAKHMGSLIQQMCNFIGINSNEFAGAQSFSSMDTYLAPFVKKDNMTYEQVKQCMQGLLHNLNMPSRWATQPPFSNVTLDFVAPKDLADKNPKIGKSKCDFTYGDCAEEQLLLVKAFLEAYIEGDAKGAGFQYPIITVNVTKDFDSRVPEDLQELLWSLTSKYGSPYFANFINSDMNPEDVRSMCCRLRLDTKGMDAFNARMSAGGVGGAGEKTGSIGVVTISLPKVGYLAKDEDDLFARLGKLMDIAAASLAIKRKVITQELKTGLYPYTKRYLGGFQNHFSTIGFVGLNELCVNFMQKDLTTPEGNAFGKKVLEYMKERKNQYSEKYKQLFNLEATPAESTAYRLAKHNKAQYPELFTQGTEETPYYTNSMWLPVNSDIIENDVWKAIELEEPLQCVVDGGTVMHVFLGEQITDWRKTKDFVFKVFNSSKMPYITMSPKYSVCKHGHGYISGDTNGVCPMCKKEQLEAYKQELAKLDELEKELK